MYNKFFNAMYVFNTVLQAIITLASPVAVGIFFAWLLTERAGVGDWIYVVLIILGVMSGLVSMVRFVLSAMAGIERLENEQKMKKKTRAADFGKAYPHRATDNFTERSGGGKNEE